jgi:hypothetical protein
MNFNIYEHIMVEKEEKKEGKKIEDSKKKKKNELNVKEPKKAPKNKFDKKKTQEIANKELEEISKSSFARLTEPHEVDRESHLRADKKPFLKKKNRTP